MAQPPLGLQQPTPPQTDMSHRLQAADSTVQVGHANGGDGQEEVYQKIKAMKELYLPELNEMHEKIVAKLRQYDSLEKPNSEQYEKIKLFKTMLERAITFLQVPKTGILPGYREKLVIYEKQIVNFINTNRPRRPVSQLLDGQVPSSHIHTMQQPQSQIALVQSHENAQRSVAAMQQNNVTSLHQNSTSTLSGVSTLQQNMVNSLQARSNMGSRQVNALNSLQQVYVRPLQQNPVSAPQQANIYASSDSTGPSVAFLDSTVQRGHENGGDLQEEVYQKIQAMKELYLPELDEMYQKTDAKLQQFDSLEKPKSEQYEKIKLFKTMLERAITFLQVPKTSILPGYGEKLAHYEKQIVTFINTNRPRRPVSQPQQGQVPPSRIE